MNAGLGMCAHQDAQACSEDVYENVIPDFVPAELERLYGNTFSSFLAEHVQESDTCTYVACKAGVTDTILLFKMRKRRIQVLNAAIHIAPEQIRRFASFILARYPTIQVIGLTSVTSGLLGNEYPIQRFRISEDYVLSLPSTVAAYKAGLGKATASGMRAKQNRLMRDIPEVSFQVRSGTDIDDSMLQAIFCLKNAGRRGRLDEEQQAWLRKVVRTHGFLGVTLIDGRVGAAALSTRIGSRLFLHVLAHDRAFDTYSLGMLNTYLAVCAGIQDGAREYHFLWGSGIWKRRLGAAERQLENIFVYRSRAARLASSRLVIANLLAAHWRRLRLGMLAASEAESRYAWLVRPCLNGWYRFKGALA
jgi:hypothetical protein